MTKKKVENGKISGGEWENFGWRMGKFQAGNHLWEVNV